MTRASKEARTAPEPNYKERAENSIGITWKGPTSDDRDLWWRDWMEGER
jgi:hypothetical protein